jgi:hypothetical protein
MANTFSNHFKFQLADKQVDLANGGDTIKLVLMDTGFSFDKDADATWADVSADALGAANGYTGAITLSNQALAEDDANDKASATWDDETITASGGSIGPTPGAIVYDDTTSDDTIIMYIDFGSELTITDGNSLVIEDIEVKIE